MAHSLPPVHPGEILFVEFMEPLGLTQYRLAKETAVSPRRINEIVHGLRAITPDTALRLAKFFGTSEMFWLNLQARYDLDVQKQRLSSTVVLVQTLSPLQKGRLPKTSRSRAAAPQSADRPALRRKVK